MALSKTDLTLNKQHYLKCTVNKLRNLQRTSLISHFSYMGVELPGFDARASKDVMQCCTNIYNE